MGRPFNKRLNSSSKLAWCVSSIFSASPCHLKTADRGPQLICLEYTPRLCAFHTRQGALQVLQPGVRIYKRTRHPSPLSPPSTPRTVHQTGVSYTGDPPAPPATCVCLAHSVYLLCLCIHPTVPGLLLKLKCMSMSPGGLAKTQSPGPQPWRFQLRSFQWGL